MGRESPTEDKGRIRSSYDVVIIGAGHNGLVAATYLGQAGLSVLVLERNPSIGGATRSARPFPGVDANLSVYSYLVSLFPEKIVQDLRLDLQLLSRPIASYTPNFKGDHLEELLVSNGSPARTQESFHALPGGREDYAGYCKLQEMQQRLADVIWPTLLKPLRSKADILGNLSSAEREAWDCLMEIPLGQVIEEHIGNDLIRGLLFTDAKIGVSTHPHDESLLQNKTFLYHIIGRGTGEWSVPVGGMGQLTRSLEQAAERCGVQIVTAAQVKRLHPEESKNSVSFETQTGSRTVEARFVLCNAAPMVLDRLLGKDAVPCPSIDEGSVVKINMLLKRLPQLRSVRYSPEEAFGGTFHIDEGYDQMTDNFHRAAAGELAEKPGGEVYCHSLTDPSILSQPLNEQGYHALTLFGLDMPYTVFAKDNEHLRALVLERYFAGINRFTVEPIEDCLAEDAEGNPCVEIKTAVDLEREIHLPRGNIFHNALSWPYADREEKVGTWGVETEHSTVFLCGSGALRGGAVSGIPGHNAAMKVLGKT